MAKDDEEKKIKKLIEESEESERTLRKMMGAQVEEPAAREKPARAIRERSYERQPRPWKPSSRIPKPEKPKRMSSEGGHKKLKVIIAIVVIIGIIALVPMFVLPRGMVAPAGNNIVKLEPYPATVGAGEQLRVDIVAEDVDDVVGVQASITYDPALFSYDRVEEGTFLKEDDNVPTLMLDVIDATQPGRVSDIMLVRLGNPGTSGSGTIASVYLTAISPGNADFGMDIILVGDSTVSLIPVTSFNTTVTVT